MGMFCTREIDGEKKEFIHIVPICKVLTLNLNQVQHRNEHMVKMLATQLQIKKHRSALFPNLWPFHLLPNAHHVSEANARISRRLLCLCVALSPWEEKWEPYAFLKLSSLRSWRAAYLAHFGAAWFELSLRAAYSWENISPNSQLFNFGKAAACSDIYTELCF